MYWLSEKEIQNGIILHHMEKDELCPEKKAKNNLSMDEYKETMKGVYTTSINENTLDESPMTYKKLEDIIDVIKESVDVIDIMKPIYNFKASE